MTITAHFDALSVYAAGAIRLVPTDGDPEDLLGQGGGLRDAFDRVGQGPLLGGSQGPAQHNSDR